MSKKRSKTDYQLESIQKRYTVSDKELGEGGNAVVMLAKDLKTGQEVAIKRLTARGEEKTDRFHDEIKIMQENTGVEGVMPILDSDEAQCWYAMPVATKVMDWSKKGFNACEEISSYFTCVDRRQWVLGVALCVLDCAKTLHYLHERGVHHRDIKPDNIYLLNDRCYLGDFGLVEFPSDVDRKGHTREDKGLGAIFTIAPEMKRNPKNQDGAKADVYSLAKSFWMLLTLDEQGFDGQYFWNDKGHGLRSYQHMKDIYLVEIEELLTESTSNLPEYRPTMSQFIQKLMGWLSTIGNQQLQQANEWKFIVKRIFSDRIPSRTEYNDPESIVGVLNILASSSASNHMLFPVSGGLDFTHAMLAPEEGFIYLFSDFSISLLKPRILYFESFRDSRWNYFLIESDEVKPIKGISVSRHGDQELVEDMPAHYVDAIDSVYGVYDYDSGTTLPKGWKRVERFTKGKFLIVMKTFGYNQIPSTYDGRHSLMSNEEFRNYVSTLQGAFETLKSKGYQENEIFNSHPFGEHPYPDRIESIDLEIPKGDKLPDPTDFISKNDVNWDFSDIMLAERGNGKLAYRFAYEKDNSTFHSLFEDKQTWYLAENGHVVCDIEGSPQPYEVYDRDLAISILKKLNHRICEKCEGYDTDSLVWSEKFDIEWRRIGMPSHLFTKEEIETEMRKADDRVNNQLVIDEDGYAHVLPITERGYGSLYPVCHEIWGGRHNYVGKYSNLITLEDDYTGSLDGWLRYLNTGNRVYVNDSSNIGTAELFEGLEKFYSQS